MHYCLTTSHAAVLAALENNCLRHTTISYFLYTFSLLMLALGVPSGNEFLLSLKQNVMALVRNNAYFVNLFTDVLAQLCDI